MKYSDKLRDPRWQKLRLEVMNRAYFTCEKCFDDKSTLHVHHNYYVGGREPWEYRADSLSCICENCHKLEKDNATDIPEWEEAANLQLAIHRETNGTNGDKPHIASIIHFAAYCSGWPDSEFLFLLDRLTRSTYNKGGLCNVLLALEKEGVL
jgi:hypothetical protein